MGWANDLQQASFRGVEFECISTKDAVARALAIHQAPYSSKAQIEDMGSDARQTSFRILLEGDDYKLYLDALEIAFNLTGSGELIHPIDGIKNVYVANYNVGHDTELVDGCYIDVDFVSAEITDSLLFIPIRLPEKIEYVMGRTLDLSRSEGKTTTLKLKRQGDWAQPLLYKEPTKKAKAVREDKTKGLGDAERGIYEGDS